MKAKALIEENNRKRKLLTKDNETYYTGLLLYIRTSSNKSEQETEEILMEVLDHLLEAQAEGRTAADVFGDNPEAYAKEIAGELPAAMPKEVVKTLAMMGFIFLGVSCFVTGLLTTILSYGFDLLEPVYELYVGSFVVKGAASLFVVYALVAGTLKYLRQSAFRQVNRKKEFWTVFLAVAGITVMFMAGHYFIPPFGPVIGFPVYWLMAIGAVCYGAGRWLLKK